MKKRLKSGDWLEYVKQVRKLKRKMKKAIEDSGAKASDWTVRLGKDDKLYPVHSICFYHGTEEWNGPESLRDMMDFEDAPPGWENLFHDYGMTLFCANRVEDFSVFKTELRQLLEVIPCRKSKRKLKRRITICVRH